MIMNRRDHLLDPLQFSNWLGRGVEDAVIKLLSRVHCYKYAEIKLEHYHKCHSFPESEAELTDCVIKLIFQNGASGHLGLGSMAENARIF